MDHSEKQLKTLFNSWAKTEAQQFSQKQWLLSKWEVIEGIEWSDEKVAIMVKSILEGLDLKSEDHLLDLGCGGGWILKILKNQCRWSLGIDISFEMLQHDKDIRNETQLICGEAAQLPFRDHSFDKILSYFVFINITDELYTQRSIIEIIRILKKGGRALLGQLPDKDLNIEYDKAKEQYIKYCEEKFQLGRNLRDNHSIPIHLFDRKKMEQFLNEEGISYQIHDSFNPFYREGESPSIPWRFDLVIEKR